LQATLQSELSRDHRSLADGGEAAHALDQIRCVLCGDLRQQIGFQPWRQRQAVVHDDLLAQGLQGAEGVGETIVIVRPPTDAAQAFRVQTTERGLQGLIAGEGFAFGAFLVQRVAQIAGGLLEGRLHGVKCSHGGEGGRGRLAIGFGGAPTGGAVTLGGEQVVQGIEAEQLAHAGTLTGNQIELVAIVLTNHQQAAGQRQNEQQKQQLEFTREAKPPQQFDPR